MAKDDRKPLPNKVLVRDIKLDVKNHNMHREIDETRVGLEKLIPTAAEAPNFLLYKAISTLSEKLLKDLYAATTAKYKGEKRRLPDIGRRRFSSAVPKRYGHDHLNKNIQKIVMWKGFYLGRQHLLKSMNGFKPTKFYDDISCCVEFLQDDIEDDGLSGELKHAANRLVRGKVEDLKGLSVDEYVCKIMSDKKSAYQLMKKAIWNNNEYHQIADAAFLLGNSDIKASGLKRSAYTLIDKTHKKWEGNLL